VEKIVINSSADFEAFFGEFMQRTLQS